MFDEIANVQRVDTDRTFVRGKPESVYLVEVLPGDFVLYGASYGSATLKPLLFTCMCLGTVGFRAPAGVLPISAGSRAIRRTPSKIPELKDETGVGAGMTAIFTPLAATVRRVRPDTPLPAGIQAASVRPAKYRAIARFVNPRAISIARLAAVPGVLACEGRKVIDTQTGEHVQEVR